MKKTAIYIRVSTDAQFEEGYSIDAQKEMLSAYCVSKQLPPAEYYIDGGYTGSNIDRPELQRLIADVKAGRVGCVLVYKLDRLSRSQKDTLYLIEDVFNPHNADFVSLNESMDTSTPLGRLMLGILSAFAQLERENIRERTRMGMRERVKSGLWPGGGRVPFGYDYDRETGVLVPNRDAETVRKIYSLYLEGYSTAKIARMTGLKYEKLAQQILKRKSNAGYIQYNGEEYRGRHEPIVSLDTYQRAMTAMAQRSRTRMTDSPYLLTGLLYCGQCGAKMRYQKWGSAGCKIVCYSQDKSKPHLVRDEHCDNARLWAEDLEQAVRDDLFSFASGRQKGSPLPEKQNILALLKRQHEETSRKIKRLYHLFAEEQNDLLLGTIQELREQLGALQAQMAQEEAAQNAARKTGETRKILTTLRQSWNHMTVSERRRVVRSCVERIVVTDGAAEVYYRVDSGQGTVDS